MYIMLVYRRWISAIRDSFSDIRWSIKRQEPKIEDEDTSDMSEVPLSTTESKREKIKKINNYYPFSQAIMNLHHGKPTTSSVDLSPREGKELGPQLFVVSLPVERSTRSRAAQ